METCGGSEKKGGRRGGEKDEEASAVRQEDEGGTPPPLLFPLSLQNLDKFMTIDYAAWQGNEEYGVCTVTGLTVRYIDLGTYGVVCTVCMYNCPTKQHQERAYSAVEPASTFYGDLLLR
jgi:hypothetical protein